jgi:N-acetyl-anhydromuramyl-L-alanine amidase AmpD
MKAEEVLFPVLHWYGTDWSGSPPTTEAIRNYHINSNGWSDIGYHFIIDRNGKVSNGRSVHSSGAHAPGANQCSLGILILASPKNPINSKQEEAVIDLILSIDSGKYGEFKNFMPLGIQGHRDVANRAKTYSTECPGDLIYSKIPNWKERMQVQMSDGNDYSGHWAKDNIEWVIEQGLMSADKHNNFYPDRTLTRAEIATILKGMNQKMKEK